MAVASAAITAREPGEDIALGRPTEAGWFPLADLSAAGAVECELERVAAHGSTARLPRQVAASYLASWVDSCVAGPAALLLALEGVLPEVSPTNLWLHRPDAEPWFDRVAFEDLRFWCREDHPAAGHPDALPVATDDELAARYADAVVAALAPIFTEVRAVGRYGERGMWGSFADDVAGSLMWITRANGGDPAGQHRVWQTLEGLFDAVADRAPRFRVRPEPVEVAWSGGATVFSRRGTCCLYYQDPAVASEPEPDRYCTSCPKREPAGQRVEWAAWLEEGGDD